MSAPLPTWMRPQPFEPEPIAAPGGRLARKALGGFAKILSETLDLEATASLPGLLQSLDARSKVIGLLGLVVVATLVHNLATLALAYGLCLALALVSCIPLKRLAKVWLAVPLFTLAIMVPAMLDVVTPGRALLHIGGVSVTDAGLVVAGRMVLRTAVCVTLALLLAATTPSAKLFRGLRTLGIPTIFVTLLTMMDRYLQIVMRSAHEIHLARVSRSIRASSLGEEHDWVAAGMGSIFRRSQSLGGKVYNAMVSRGYTGDVFLLDEPRWSGRDWLFLGFAVLTGATFLLLK